MFRKRKKTINWNSITFIFNKMRNNSVSNTETVVIGKQLFLPRTLAYFLKTFFFITVPAIT